MSNNDFIDVDYIDIQKEVFLTAPDVAREIPTDEKRVRYWGDVFGDIKECGVHKIDGRKRYTRQTIKAFKLIQKLIDEKQFSHIQVRDYVSKNGFEYITNSNNISSDLIGFQGLSSELSIEIEQRLNSFLKSLKNQLLENNELLKSDIKEQVSLTVDEVISDKLEESMSGIEKELQFQKVANKNLSEKLQNIQQELALTQDTNKKLEEELSQKLESQSQQIQNNFNDMSEKIISENTKMINDFKYVKIEKESESKSFLSKLFHFKD